MLSVGRNGSWKEMGEEMMHNWESKDGDLEEEEEEEEAGRIRQVHLLLWKKLPLTPALYSPKMEFIHSVISVVCFHITERKKKNIRTKEHHDVGQHFKIPPE